MVVYKKKIIAILFFLLLLIPPLYFAGEIFEAAAAHNTVNAHTARRYADFYALPPDSLDMVFIGSSHSYCTFDPEIFDSRLGTSSFQLGTPLQHADTAYYSLEMVMQTQKPSIVVYELYWGMVGEAFDLKQADALFQVLKDGGLKDQYIREVLPLAEKLKYHIKAVRYQPDYFAYKSKDLEDKIEQKFGVSKKTVAKNGVEEYRSKGYVYCDIVMPDEEYGVTNQFKGYDGRSFQIDALQRYYIEKMAQLCEENGVVLLFVTAPIAPVSLDYIENYDAVHNELAALALELKIPYVDYNLSNSQQLENTQFRDDAHLNDSGVQTVCMHFIDWLIENGIWQDD